MTTTSRTAMIRAKGMAGTMGVDKMGGMGTGTTHTDSNSTTTTAMTLKDIRTMTICGDLFLLTKKKPTQKERERERACCYNNITH